MLICMAKTSVPSLIRRRTLSCSWMRHTETQGPLFLDALRWFVALSSWWKKERLIAHLFIYCAKIINCLNSIFPRHNVTGVDHATSKEHNLKSYSLKIILPTLKSWARIKTQDAVVVAVIFASKAGHDKYTFSYLKCSRQKSQIALIHAIHAWGRARLLKPLEDAFEDSNSNTVAKIGGCNSGELL